MLVTSSTYVVSAGAIVAVGALQVFADVNPDGQNISAETIATIREVVRVATA